jgi:hypothetical protein
MAVAINEAFVGPHVVGRDELRAEASGFAALCFLPCLARVGVSAGRMKALFHALLDPPDHRWDRSVK